MQPTVLLKKFYYSGMLLKCNYFDGLIVAVLFSFLLLYSVTAQSPHSLLLIVAFDGLRYDFIDPTLTPNLYKIAQQGAWAREGMVARYRTQTTPNFYSLSTGLHPETHGIIDNIFYDPVLDKEYDYWNIMGQHAIARDSLNAEWYMAGEPIWLTNQAPSSGDIKRNSGCYYWPHCDARHASNRTASFVAPMELPDDLNSWIIAFDKLFAKFMDPVAPINFGAFYIEEPDLQEHGYDIFGNEVHRTLLEVDKLAGYIYRRISESILCNRLNLIFLADHGMTNEVTPTNQVDLYSYLTNDWSKVRWSANTLFPVDKSVNMTVIYQLLKKAEIEDKKPVRIYLKNDFPKQYHFANNRRVGDVLIQPNLGYYITHDAWSASHGSGGGIRKSLRKHGNHGFFNDNPDMRAFFIAIGPAFKRHFALNDTFDNVDVYPLMCKVLGLKPAANNGSLSTIGSLLLDRTGEQHFPAEDNACAVHISFPQHRASRQWTFYWTVMLPFTGCAFLVMALLVCRVRRAYHQRRRERSRIAAVSTAKPLQLKSCDDFADWEVL